MNDVITPKDAKSVEQTVQWALAEGKTLEIVGSGSKQAIGRPTQTDLTLSLHALAGVTLYEPEELVLSARAGTPLAEIEALLAANVQQLAFEPMDCGPILGGAAGRGTIGGTLASNFSGPRRLKAGAARDHLLGFQAVSGRGEAFKSGGRVVKNVTGYDLSKLMVGLLGDACGPDGDHAQDAASAGNRRDGPAARTRSGAGRWPQWRQPWLPPATSQGRRICRRQVAALHAGS